ncbi:MAG: hypothetical protein JSV96_15940 [Candidatus Aminicenantes bacterium]|nr:MAG: hypothetical protein JSV96_15940 [Candidatus Aminicenantes bacterium]
MITKRLFLSIMLISLFLLPNSLTAELYIQTDLLSRYIWRGFDLNPHRNPVIQLSMGYAFGKSGLAIDLWSSFSFENKELHEFNLYLTYEKNLSKYLSLKAGLIHYGWYFAPEFSLKDDTSHEAFVSASLSNVLIDPSLTVFYDFTNGDGFYILFEAGYNLKLLKSVGLDLSASLGYNGGQWLAEGVEPGFSDLNLSITLPVTVGRFRISALAAYTVVLLDAIGKDNHFWYGIRVDYK